MKQHYKLLSKDKIEEENNKIALALFEGNYCNCKKLEHYKKDCRLRNRCKKFSRNYYECRKPNHKAKDCQLKAENTSKRPSFWKRKNKYQETSAAYANSLPKIVLAMINEKEE